jgi:hypothetical protein
MDDTIKASTIIGQVDHSFDIILESMVGSTGYGWCLKSLPSGIELISTDQMPVRTGIAPERQIFTFAPLKPLKKGSIEFDLLCLFDLSRESADHVTFLIDIHDKEENDVLKNEIGGHKFIKGSGVMVHAKPIQPYGFANPEKAIPLYGFPPTLLYGYPSVSDCATSVIHSNANCVLKYGNPFGIAVEASECNLKYGYPLMKYGYPPIYKYGFPLSNTAGGSFVVKEDAKNCVVKYGTPGGIAKNPGDCVLKYGFPIAK